MFDRLTERLTAAFRKLAGAGRLTETEVSTGLREIRLALLEADVNLGVAKRFVERIKPRAVGQDVLGALTPVEQLTKLVYDELTAVLGGADFDPRFRFGPGQAVVMIVGLNGSGKTTTAAKLALRFKTEGMRPLLVAADLSRPAAIDQLEQLGRQVHTQVFRSGQPTADPVGVARDGVAQGAKESLTPVLVDTAGRMSIDESLMDELARVKEAIQPAEILLVVDALTGQDAVETAQRFDERLDVTGIVLTKLDGDARGGAALSMRAVTGKPVRLIGVGEKLDGLEYFHPARMAGRILGRGDVLSLVEKAQAAVDEQEALRFEKKLRKHKRFDLQDFLDALKQTRRVGSMRQLLSLIPGLKLSESDLERGQADLGRFEAIVNSMTPGERADPRLLNAGRRQRIALGSGTTVQDINRFMQQFKQMQKFTASLLKGGRLPGM